MPISSIILIPDKTHYNLNPISLFYVYEWVGGCSLVYIYGWVEWSSSLNVYVGNMDGLH